MKWPCMHIRTWDGRCLCKEKGLYQPSTYYLFVLARALLICIQPGLSESGGSDRCLFGDYGRSRRREECHVLFCTCPNSADICIPCVFHPGLENYTLTGYHARLWLQLDIYKSMIQVLSFHL